MPTTPAPDLPTLLDFETQIETAAASVLAAAGVTAAITKARAATNNPSLELAIRFETGAAINHWCRTPSGKNHYDMFDGVLEITISADRDANADSTSAVYQQFEFLRGTIAAAFLEGVYPFSGLAWLDVKSFHLRPVGRNAGISESRMQDLSTMTWSLRFGIIKAAWPTSS